MPQELQHFHIECRTFALLPAFIYEKLEETLAANSIAYSIGYILLILFHLHFADYM